MSDTEKSQPKHRAAANSWANTVDRTARTAPARAAFEDKFLEEAAWDYDLAERLRSDFYRDIARRSHESRRRNKAERQAVAAERLTTAADLLDQQAGETTEGEWTWAAIAWLREEARSASLGHGCKPEALAMANAVLGANQ